MKSRKIACWSITVAVAGFLFGFDVAVISGAGGMLVVRSKGKSLKKINEHNHFIWQE